jgi:hypothetical protein
MMKTTRYSCVVLGLLAACFAAPHASAGILGYADIVYDYYDSGAGPMAGPYGGTWPSPYPVPVTLDVVLGDDPGPELDFLSLPTGSYVTVGFLDEVVIDGPGDDLFIQEVGVAGERAEVYISANLVDYFFLGIAADDVTTAFDLASIGFAGQVRAVQVIGLDDFGGSPGFDVVNVQGLPGSIQVIPEPASMTLMGLGAGALALRRYLKKRS